MTKGFAYRFADKPSFALLQRLLRERKRGVGRKGPGFLRILPRLFLFPSLFPICAWMVGCGKLPQINYWKADCLNLEPTNRKIGREWRGVGSWLIPLFSVERSCLRGESKGGLGRGRKSGRMLTMIFENPWLQYWCWLPIHFCFNDMIRVRQKAKMETRSRSFYDADTACTPEEDEKQK